MVVIEDENGGLDKLSAEQTPVATKSLPRIRLTKWDPSEWYRYRASPTVKRLIHRHIAGKHTEHCIAYDVNYYGWYCKWLTDVFWPRPYFTTAIELSQQNATDAKANNGVRKNALPKENKTNEE